MFRYTMQCTMYCVDCVMILDYYVILRQCVAACGGDAARARFALGLFRLSADL